IDALLEEKYGSKKAMMVLNHKAIQAGYRYAKQHLQCPLPFHVKTLEAANSHRETILIDGNTALALGRVFAGATVAAWYPITPSTSLMDAFKMFADRMRVDRDTGAKNCA